MVAREPERLNIAGNEEKPLEVEVRKRALGPRTRNGMPKKRCCYWRFEVSLGMGEHFLVGGHRKKVGVLDQRSRNGKKLWASFRIQRTECANEFY